MYFKCNLQKFIALLLPRVQFNVYYKGVIVRKATDRCENSKNIISRGSRKRNERQLKRD